CLERMRRLRCLFVGLLASAPFVTTASQLAHAQAPPGGARAPLDPKVSASRDAQLLIERGDAMLAAGRRDLALESYLAAERLLGGDPAKRAVVVARAGQALEGMGKDDEAVAAYRRAIKSAPKGFYLEVELTGRIVDIYRRKQALPQLIAELAQAWPERA